MAHEVESAFYVKEPAWHNEGIVLSTAPTIADALIQASLDWTVEETDVIVNENVVDEYKALVRSTDHSVLSIVGSNYTPLQNKDAFEWFDFLLNENLATLEAGGSLRHGKRVWVLAKIRNTEDEVVKNDVLNSYLLLSNAHDGKMGVWIMFTPIRVVCMNTLTAAISDAERYGADAQSALFFKHIPSLKDKLMIAKDVIDVQTQSFRNTVIVFKQFSEKPITSDQFMVYVKNVLDIEDAQKPRVTKKLIELFDNGVGSDIQGVRGTLWGAYNAFTEFIDHTKGHATKSKLNTMWFGPGAVLRKKAYEEAIKLL